MTREDAVAKYMEFGMGRLDRYFRQRAPEWWCNKVLRESAEDTVDGLVALGLLTLEPSAGEKP